MTDRTNAPNKKPGMAPKLPAGITTRKDGRFQGRFTVNGKRYTIYDKNLKILKKKLADAKYEVEHGINGTLSSLTLNTWFQIWLKEYKLATVKKSTVLLYSSSYDRYIRSHIGGMRLSSLCSLHIQKLYNDLKSSGLSSGTIQIVNSILSNVFTQAIRNDILMKNPCSGSIIPKEEKKQARVLTGEEQRLFLQIIEGGFYEPLYTLALATGLRIGELAALSWEDIDLSAGTLSVRRTLLYQKDVDTGKFEFRFQTPKSQSSRRTLPLLPGISAMLKEHRIRQGILVTPFLQALPSEFHDLVFTTKNGTPIQESSIFKRMERITRQMNEYENALAAGKRVLPIVHEKITPHTLRHSFATRAFENGIPPKIVQDLLGHSSLTLTMDLYTHVTADVKAKEINKLASLFQLPQ